MKIDGGCHCGAITYEAEIDPEAVFTCHCSDCQTLSGAPFRTVVRAPEADFKLTSGELKIYVKTADSGRKRVQAFCPDCGSPIYSTSAGDGPKDYGIRLGTARQRDLLAPKAHWWFGSAVPWLAQLSDLPTVDEQ